jgi:hypothetical protein
MKIKIFVAVLIVVFLLVSCAPAVNVVPTKTAPTFMPKITVTPLYAEWTNSTDREIAQIVGNVAVNTTVETIITIIFSILLFGFLVIGMYDVVAKKDPVLLLMFPGAVVCSLLEGSVGVLGTYRSLREV